VRSITARRRGGTSGEIPPLDDECESILKPAVQELALSARAHHKTIRVASTIADLDGSENIQAQDLCEAVQYRNLDRQTWF